MKKSSVQLKAGIILTIGMLTITFTFYGYQILFTPNIQNEKEDVYLYIPTGGTFQNVTDSLQKNSILQNPLPFYFLSKLMHYRDHVKPGRYLLKKKDGPNPNTLQLVKMLKAGRQSPVKLTFTNVRIKDELADKLSKKLEFKKTELLNLLNDPTFLKKYNFDTVTVMTMFIPNTYEMYWNLSAESFFKRMHEEYEKFWNDARKQKAEALGLSPAQVSIVASIVEAETNKNPEKARVAGVYLNRLKINMPLQADPTLKFALRDFALKRIYTGMFDTDSPYNTYKYAGLPPGPINLPSITTIDAVLNREDHKFIYFCASDQLNGYHLFAEDYRQHQNNRNKYVRALNKLNIH